jgi:hypothetical protein
MKMKGKDFVGPNDLQVWLKVRIVSHNALGLLRRL